MSLIVQADVENVLGLASGGLDTEASKVTVWIGQAQAIAEGWCEQPLEHAAVTDSFEVDQFEPWHPLSRFPVTAITSVTVDGTVLTTSEYRVYPKTGIVRRISGSYDQSWSQYVDGNVVVYDAGYGSGATAPYDTVPADLVYAVASLTAALRAQTSEPGGRAISQIQLEGSDTITYAVDAADLSIVTPQIQNLLAPYRRPM